jgi:hypothetical protein
MYSNTVYSPSDTVCCMFCCTKVMMLLAWQQLTTSPMTNSIFSYWQLASVHGKSWAYNGVDPPAS